MIGHGREVLDGGGFFFFFLPRINWVGDSYN